MKRLHITTYRSPIGEMEIVLDGEVLVGLEFSETSRRTPQRLRGHLSRRYGDFELHRRNEPTPVNAALDIYFSRGGDPFRGLKLEPGGTPFQRRVWGELRRTRFGSTLDYATLAARAGNPRAVRATASSNARNPIAIVVPCHRVIGRDGTLRGYAGGIERKRWLIDHERRTPCR